MQEVNPLTIVVPTDFSFNAYRALEFAVMLAQKASAKLDILHLFSIQVIPSRGGNFTELESSAENLANAEEQMQEMLASLKGIENVDYKTTIRPVYGPVEIPEIILTEPGDLIIMGTAGTKGLSKWILGSNTANVIRNTHRPVLAIPTNTDCNGVERIGFAYDGLPIADFSNMNFIVQLARILDTHIDVIHVASNEQQDRSSSSDMVEIFKYFGDRAGDYHYMGDQSMHEGIHTAVEEYDIDVLAMMQRQKSTPGNLIREKMINQFLDKLKTGLLVLPESTGE